MPVSTQCRKQTQLPELLVRRGSILFGGQCSPGGKELEVRDLRVVLSSGAWAFVRKCPQREFPPVLLWLHDGLGGNGGALGAPTAELPPQVARWWPGPPV